MTGIHGLDQRRAPDEGLLGFTTALRAAGVAVTHDRSAAFLEACAHVGLADPAVAFGAVLLALILSFWGLVWPALLALVALGAALALKLAYFARIDGSSAGYTVQMALGLSPDARVRVLDPPHSRPNFVMREMGYQVGRRHATRLRRIALGALFGAPLVLIVVSLLGFAPALLTLAVLSLALGLIVERWLFFAEARHVAMLYYGQSEA